MTFSTPENQTSIGTVTVTDADADSISFTVTSNAPAATGSNTNNAFPQDNDSSLDETDYYVARPNPGDGVLLVVDDIDDEMVITFRNSAGVILSSLLVTRTSSPRYYDVKSYISADGSTIELTLRNNSRLHFAWELQIGGVSVHSNSCGQFNVRGCANDSYSSGIVYQATIFLGGPNSYFNINNSGNLSFINPPDYETKSQYQGTVTASDGSNSTTQDITVNVTDVQE